MVPCCEVVVMRGHVSWCRRDGRTRGANGLRANVTVSACGGSDLYHEEVDMTVMKRYVMRSV